jgi:hypothetical protein
MNRRLAVPALLAAILLLPASTNAGTRGGDEIFWLPSFEQALEMADHTGQPIFLMFFTLVGKGCETYTGPEKTVL